MDEENKSYSRSYFTPKNLIIYAIVAVILYGAVYVLFLKKGNNNPYSTTTNQTNTTPTEGATTGTMTVDLAAQNNSGENGTATLSEENGKTTVTVKVDGAPTGVEEPAHIHNGSCPTPGAVLYPLNNLVDGQSTTVLDVDLATIKAGMPLAVNVHKSNAEVNTYVSCGDLK